VLIDVFLDDHGDRKCCPFHKAWPLPALTIEKTSHLPDLKILRKTLVNPASFICQAVLTRTYQQLSWSITEGCWLEVIFRNVCIILFKEGYLRGNANLSTVPSDWKPCQISFFALCWDLHWPNRISCNDPRWVGQIGTAEHSHFCRLLGKD
jgi:hypothetical protein